MVAAGVADVAAVVAVVVVVSLIVPRLAISIADVPHQDIPVLTALL